MKISDEFADVLFPPKCLICGRFLISGESLYTQFGDSNENEYNAFQKAHDYLTAGGLLPEILRQFSRYFCHGCFSMAGGLYIKNNDIVYRFRELPLQETGLSVDHNDTGEIVFPDIVSGSLDSHSNFQVKGASLYNGIVREAIHLFKYNGKTCLANPLGLLLFRSFVEYCGKHNVDFVVPVPLHRWKMIKRGFNQSFLLLRNFRNYWLKLRCNNPEWEILPGIITRKRHTESQTGFNHEQRRNNIKGAFAVRKSHASGSLLKGKHIVIVDDVYTTGATATEAGYTLLEAGAGSVAVIVLAFA